MTLYPYATRTEALLRYLARWGASLDAAVMHESLRVTAQALIEAEVTRTIEAGHYERSGNRKTHRNGYRERGWAAAGGHITLHIPKLRNGSYYPAFLRGAEGVIAAFVQQALIEGAGAAEVNGLTERLGLPALPDALCHGLTQALDTLRARLHERALPQPYPYLWLNLLDAGTQGRVAVALGIGQDGVVTLLDFETFSPNEQDDWALFVARLVRRRLRGVDTVLAEAHHGLREAAVARLPFAAWRTSHVEHVGRLIEQLEQEAAVVAAISDTAIHPEDDTAAGVLHVHDGWDGAARALCRAA